MSQNAVHLSVLFTASSDQVASDENVTSFICFLKLYEVISVNLTYLNVILSLSLTLVPACFM